MPLLRLLKLISGWRARDIELRGLLDRHMESAALNGLLFLVDIAWKGVTICSAGVSLRNVGDSKVVCI